MARHAPQPKQRPTRRPAPAPPAAAPPAVEFLPPPKPRRGLFAALMGAMVLWIVFLLVLYFTTVYPQRAKEHWRQAHPNEVQGAVPRAASSSAVP